MLPHGIRGMNVVVPAETYPRERRVMILPASARVLVEAGHRVFVQAGASSGIDIPDSRYAEVGATIIADAAQLYDQITAEDRRGMVVKMKAPYPTEFSFMRRAILLCMLHIEQNRDRLWHMHTQELVGVSMEDIRDGRGKRLVDQTDVTGKVGVLYALRHSSKLPDDMRAVILGYGNVATGAIEECAKLGIKYKIMRRSELKKLPQWLHDADILINAITWPESARRDREYLVTREDIKNSNPGMIVLDLSVDFPNPIETIHPTDYQNPFYMEEGRVHISIYGYPGLVPVSSSRIYSEQVLPVVLAIANNNGLEGIGTASEIGPFIKRAIVSLTKYGDVEQYRPTAPSAPRIE